MVAETEAVLKLQRLERDMPKFLRAQRRYVNEFNKQERWMHEEAAAAVGMSTEEFLARQGS